MGVASLLIAAVLKGTLAVPAAAAKTVDRPPVRPFGGSVSDALDTGFYFAAIGGLIGFDSGFLPSGWAARRTVEQDTAVIDERAYDR